MGCGSPPPPPPPPCFIYTPVYYNAPAPVIPPPPPPVLKECKIDAYIVDIHSYVTISQKFHNPSNQATNSLTYTFGVLAGAAVCKFELVRESGKKIIGVVKEKDQAQQEMNAAIAAGHTAALGEEQTKDGEHLIRLILNQPTNCLTI